MTIAYTSETKQNITAPDSAEQAENAPAMKELLTLLDQFIASAKAKANAALTGLPPVDQFQGSQQVVGVINTMEWFKSDLARMEEQFAGIAAKFDAAVKTAGDAKLAAALEAGEVIKKSDVDAAIATAKDQVRQEEEGKVAAERTRLSTITARRAELTTAHGADAAAALPDDVVAAEAFDGVKTEVARRIGELEVIGITAAAKRETFAEILVEAPFTDEGKAAFDKQITRIKDIAGIKPGTATFTRQPGKPGAGQPTVPAGGAPPETQKQDKPAEGKVTAAF